MHRPRVLFQVDSGDSAPYRLAVDGKLQMPVERQWQIVLRDLVALGQVRVEVVLAIEFREIGDIALQRKRRPYGEVHGLLIDRRQNTGKTEAYRTRVCVRLRTQVVRRAAAEHLAVRQELRV